MKFIDLIAIKETINVKAGGAITYETEVSTDGPGIILADNTSGEYGVALLSTFHPGGKVSVVMRATGQQPVKKYQVGQVVAKLAIL